MTRLTAVPQAPVDYARGNIDFRYTFRESELRARDRTNRLLGALYGAGMVIVCVFAFWAMGGFKWSA